MRLLLWMTLIAVDAVNGAMVLPFLTGVLLAGCAGTLRRGWRTPKGWTDLGIT